MNLQRMWFQGQGFYLGLALWPGGTAGDWQPAYDATTGVYGLNPCNVTGSYNGTGHTHRAYLVLQLNASTASSGGETAQP